MGLRTGWSAIALALGACGAVAVTSDAQQQDTTMSGGGAANGAACTAGPACASGICTCRDATCSAKVCSPEACACGFDSTGGGTCDGLVAAGYDDAADTCAASTCDGTGACGTPLLWYRFDENAGTGSVSNGGTWPGTTTSVAGTQGVAGKDGQAIQLGGPSEGVVIDDPADGSLDAFASWTAEAWINLSTLPTTGSPYATLVKKDQGYICRIGFGSGPGCTSGGCFFASSIAFTPTQQAATWLIAPVPTASTWYHLACSFSGGNVKLYWNGSLVLTTTGTASALANSTNAFGLGRSPAAGGGENLQGLVDDFKMWNTARSDRQICIDACGSYSGTTCTFDGMCGK